MVVGVHVTVVIATQEVAGYIAGRTTDGLHVTAIQSWADGCPRGRRFRVRPRRAHLRTGSCSDSWSRGRRLHIIPGRRACSKTWLSAMSGDVACPFSVCSVGLGVGSVFSRGRSATTLSRGTPCCPLWTSGINVPVSAKCRKCHLAGSVHRLI